MSRQYQRNGGEPSTSSCRIPPILLQTREPSVLPSRFYQPLHRPSPASIHLVHHRRLGQRTSTHWCLPTGTRDISHSTTPQLLFLSYSANPSYQRPPLRPERGLACNSRQNSINISRMGGKKRKSGRNDFTSKTQRGNLPKTLNEGNRLPRLRRRCRKGCYAEKI